MHASIVHSINLRLQSRQLLHQVTQAAAEASTAASFQSSDSLRQTLNHSHEHVFQVRLGIVPESQIGYQELQHLDVFAGEGALATGHWRRRNRNGSRDGNDDGGAFLDQHTIALIVVV